MEVVPRVPADAQPVGGDPHEFTRAPHAFEGHDELQTEEDLRVDARVSRSSVAVLHQVPNERKVEPLLEAAVEIVSRDQALQRDASG